MKKITEKKYYLLLHAGFLVYSLNTVFAKLAGRQDLFSLDFFIYYFIYMSILFVYALIWQIVLKNFKLSTAFANRGVCVIWGMMWGSLIFGELLTPGKIIAAALILSGIIVLGKANE
jgi:multidrug transporter EmrE-like cation transporter